MRETRPGKECPAGVHAIPLRQSLTPIGLNVENKERTRRGMGACHPAWRIIGLALEFAEALQKR
jgi:hypothetical protein